MSTNQFTIQLANGKEQSFASAAEMNAWLSEQRGLEYPKRKAKPKRVATKRRVLKRENETKQGERPLARYANRHSGEV